MKRYISAVMLGLMLTSCGSKAEDEPKGQVIATVDGQEITASQLRLEIGDLPSDQAAASAAQKAAMQNLITRKLLVEEAKKRGLDKSPMAAMFRARAEELALVQLLQMNISSGVPKVSDDEVNEYVSSHPVTFAQRKLISVDQLLVPTIDPKIVKQMEPIKTLPEIEALLNTNKVQFVRSASVIDTVGLNPEMATKITALGNDEVFVVPNASGVLVARITGTRIEPLAGAEAQTVARRMLTQQRSGVQVRQVLEQIVKDGQSKVQLNPQYSGKAAPKAGASGKAG